MVFSKSPDVGSIDGEQAPNIGRRLIDIGECHLLDHTFIARASMLHHGESAPRLMAWEARGGEEARGEARYLPTSGENLYERLGGA
jgi:hypothetical protein